MGSLAVTLSEEGARRRRQQRWQHWWPMPRRQQQLQPHGSLAAEEQGASGRSSSLVAVRPWSHGQIAAFRAAAPRRSLAAARSSGCRPKHRAVEGVGCAAVAGAQP
mmetsp:Transcript_29863/g.95207  ORF Transcript_29863/g.95207 Transcript_29863/m.95207 type:complete len:106 (+) Transcript_29863:321-638(+)